MGDADGSLNTLLKYRFVKKTIPKLSHSSSEQQNGLSRETSLNSTDSQATIPYLASQNSTSSIDSNSTIITKQSFNNESVLDSQHSDQPTSNIGSPSCSSSSIVNSTSPVFKSKFNGVQASKDVGSNSPSTSHAVTSTGPWMSTASKAASSSNGVSSFRRIRRPDPDSSDEDLGENPGIKIDKKNLQKLKEMFPDADIERMKGALFVHPNDFESAVRFVKSVPRESNQIKGVKRPLQTSQDDTDDLLEITGSRKRIKVMPESPSPTKECPQPNFAQSKTQQEAVDFLKGCYPQKSAEHIKTVLNANAGDVEKTSVALGSEDGEDAQMARSLSEKPPGPGSNSDVKPTKTISTLKFKMTNGKGSGKKRNDDESDEDEDEDEYDDEYDSGDSDDSEDLDTKTKSEIDNFLAFFEEATVEELTALPGCSKKKAEVIVTLRPFQTWENLCARFDGEKQLSTALISGCKEIMHVRNNVRRLMHRCENISQQMGNIVSSLSANSKGGDDVSDHDDVKITKQPELLNKDFALQPYQLIGLSWLRIMHEQVLNGILADEMGLGKTIQAIAFLAHLLEEGEEGPHVIIVPSSTIENWLRELQNWCPALKVIVYYGSQEERRCVRHSVLLDGEDFNVLLTTYNMATGGAEDRILFKKYDFHYAIFDEGHMLKNMSSLRFQNLMKISAERRLLLTGTPLQNNLLELMSLLCFVMPDIFKGKTESLKKMFAMITRSEDKQKSRFEQDRIAQAKRIMKPFLLRRLKKDVLQQLPKKTERIEKCYLVPCQQEVYESVVNKYVQEVAEKKESESVGGIGVFMQLRKAANHPLLLRHRYTDKMLKDMAKKIANEPSHSERGALPKFIQEDMAVMNDFELMGLCKQYKKYVGKFDLDASVMDESAKFRKLDELLPGMKEKGDRVLLFSQFTMMLDVMEHYLEHRGHKYLRMDGQTPVPDRLQLIDRFNNEPDIFIFLLSTRAGGVGINLTAANTIIIHDIDFNPYNDKQAEDRCHRLGQKREVTVFKLICEDTVDEGMLKCANDKLALEKDLTGSGHGEENEETTKDVASLLKEVLKLTQRKKEAAMGKSSEAAEGSKKS